MSDEKNWTDWMKHDDWRKKAIFRHEAEREQIRFEEIENCRLIHVRGELVGGVDLTTDVKLRLSSDTPPALIFGRQGDPLYLFVYLHKWEH